MTTTSLILNSLLKERWSISFKLYKRKKTSILQMYNLQKLLAKPIKETLKIQKFDLTSNWTGNPLEYVSRLFCCMVVHNSQSASVFTWDYQEGVSLCMCGALGAPVCLLPGQDHRPEGLVWWATQGFLPSPPSETHISGRKQGPNLLIGTQDLLN